jgi:hypothetical protein
MSTFLGSIPSPCKSGSLRDGCNRPPLIMEVTWLDDETIDVLFVISDNC